MMHDKHTGAPDSTAVRVALWRALHVEVDSPPHVFEDEVGLKLVAPDDGWRNRPDMSPFTRPFRASIVARARFIEDLVAEQAARGVGQYVLRSSVPAVRAGRLRGGRRMVGAVGSVGLRPRAASGGGVYWCQHVPDQGRDHGDVAPDRNTRSELHARHVLHASNRAGGPGSASRDRAGGRGGESKRHALHQLLHADRDANPGPSRLRRGPARIGRCACSTLLRRQARWPSSAKQFRGTASRDYLTN
jgi:hypothetical protein